MPEHIENKHHNLTIFKFIIPFLPPNQFPLCKMNDSVRKLQQGVIQEAVNDMVEKRRKGGILHMNAYTSVIDVF